MSPDCLPPKTYDSVAAKQRMELFGWCIEWNKRGEGATEFRCRLRDAGAIVKSIVFDWSRQRQECWLIDNQHVVRYHIQLKGKGPRKSRALKKTPSVDGNSTRETLHSRREIFLLVSVTTPPRYLQTRATLRSI